MRLLFSLGWFILAGLAPLHAVMANEIAVEKTEIIEKSVAAILEILRDHTNTCHRGCRYKMTNLEETQVVEVNESDEIVWQRISGIRETRQFVQSSLTSDEGVYIWLSRYPETDELERLQITTGLDHESTFKSMQIKWHLRPISATQTQVNVEMKVDHTLSIAGDPIIRNSINKTLLTLFYNFSV